MNYYLVAIFNEQSYETMEVLQKDICNKYKLYKNLPVLHITLEVVTDPDMEKLDEAIKEIIKPYRKFKVESNGVICFDAPYKSVNLEIESKGFIIRLVRKLNETLKQKGFMVRNKIDEWDLHVSLANTNYALREWSSGEYADACENTKRQGFPRMSKIDKIELWKPINNTKKMVVKSYELRTF